MNAYFPLLLSLLMTTSLFAQQKTGFKIEIIEGRHWLVKHQLVTFTFLDDQGSQVLADLSFEKFA